MLLDQDETIKKDLLDNLYTPRKKSNLEYDAYIQELPEITHDEWINNVSFKVFRTLFIDLINVCKAYPDTGLYTSSIHFSDGILNFIFRPSSNRFTSNIPIITLNIILCNHGLRDSCKKHELSDNQYQVLCNKSQKEIENSWFLNLDSKKIISEMYNFMNFCRGKIIYQEIESRY